MEKLEAEFQDIKFMSVDIDDVSEIAQKFKIRAVPTVLLTKNGEEIQRVVGLSMIEPMRKVLRDVIG